MTPTPMNPTIAAITQQTLTYTPAVLAGVQAAEAANAAAPGLDKQEAVVQGILAGSQALESAPNANVAGIAALVNLTVSIFNALGVFKHKAATK